MKLFCAFFLSIAFLQSSSAEYEDICGIENKKLSSRIIGGQEAEPNQFPWVVAIEIKKYMESELCTGSIVNKQYILTAAHCVHTFNRFGITAGVHDYTEDEPHQQIMYSNEHIIHPGFIYDDFGSHSDIALIKLKEELEFNEYVRPICLPKYSDVGKTFADENVTSTGWGFIRGFPNPIMVPELHYVNGLRVIRNDVCAQTHGSKINEDSICIDSSDHKGVCFGDSGGPMNYEIEDGKYMQIGVASFVGGNTCDDGKPQGFARVTSFLEWIEENTGRKIEA